MLEMRSNCHATAMFLRNIFLTTRDRFLVFGFFCALADPAHCYKFSWLIFRY